MSKSPFTFLCINILIICIFPVSLYSQATVAPDRLTLFPPVDIALLLAGNFGEPRINHFHSGIDIKTNGTTGVPVHAIADGYVSRIKVEPGGYGHALYIRHPNGLTTLCGHLSAFNRDIEQYVRGEQYRRESFAVDLFPEATRLVIRKGQVVAFTGNSGSSEGPHLHFEMRETQSENPVNPLIRGIKVKDDIPPIIEKLWVFSLKDRRNWIRPVPTEVRKNGSIYTPAGMNPVAMDALSGIGIEVYDLLNGSSNHCGVYRIKAYLDDSLFFESCLDEFSFAETRYMNSFMDYKTYIERHKAILKLYIDPNNQASVYRFARNRGQIEVNDRVVHQFKILVTDAAGNQSEVRFDGKFEPSRFSRDPSFLPLYQAYFNYEEPNTFKTDGFEINLPAGALYEDLYFDYSVADPRPGSFSPLYNVHRPEVPVHLFFNIAIKAERIPENLRSKATIAQSAGGSRFTSLGGTWEGDRLITRTRSFGSFCVMADTVRPSVSPLNFSTSAQLKTLNSFKFTLRDDFSGIRSYRGEIDGKWILLEYDPKQNLLEYQYDPARIQSGITHQMTVRVSDQVGNTNKYSISFFR